MCVLMGSAKATAGGGALGELEGRGGIAVWMMGWEGRRSFGLALRETPYSLNRHMGLGLLHRHVPSLVSSGGRGGVWWGGDVVLLTQVSEICWSNVSCSFWHSV